MTGAPGPEKDAEAGRGTHASETGPGAAPETEAGRALLGSLDDWSFSEYGAESGHADDIAAIEAEARSLAIDRALEAVKGLPRDRGDDEWDTVVRREVIEKLESLR